MTDNIKHTLFSKRLRFGCFAFFLFGVLFLPHICYSVNLYTFGESYSIETYLSYCGHEHFEAEYNSSDAACWPCTVIDALLNSLFYTVNKMISVVNDLAKIILLYGAAIWLAVYFLKSVSAMVTQDSAKVLDDAFAFMFKVAFIYVLIAGGVANIINWIITPLLSIGMDVSDVLKALGNS